MPARARPLLLTPRPLHPGARTPYRGRPAIRRALAPDRVPRWLTSKGHAAVPYRSGRADYTACAPRRATVGLRAHRMRRRARAPQRGRQVGEVAEERPRVARVHDLLDPEGLGGPEGRAQLDRKSVV